MCKSICMVVSQQPVLHADSMISILAGVHAFSTYLGTARSAHPGLSHPCLGMAHPQLCQGKLVECAIHNQYGGMFCADVFLLM